MFSGLTFLACARTKHQVAIAFLHISKSGGTSVCLAAEASGCLSGKYEPPWGNCQVRIMKFSDPKLGVWMVRGKAIATDIAIGVNLEGMTCVSP